MMENSLLHNSANSVFEYFSISQESRIDLEKKLSEKHRFYHNYHHINDILVMIELGDFSLEEKNILRAAAIYHDGIYNPMAKDNEKQSAQYFSSHTSLSDKRDEIEQINQIIEETSNHISSTKLSKIFCDFDLYGLQEGSFERILTDEKKIFSEFQKYDYTDYKVGRIEFLEKFLSRTNSSNKANIQAIIEFVKFRVPKIGLYAGSFNPFTKGHLNVLEKAEQIFDKVIIAKGINPEKLLLQRHKQFDKAITGKDFDESSTNGLDGLDKKLYYRQVEAFTGLITDYISKKSTNADITLIRGLRNGNDLSYEMNQLRFIHEFNPKIKTVFIHCDQEYEHISSSAIRNMLSSGDEKMIQKANYYCEI